MVDTVCRFEYILAESMQRTSKQRKRKRGEVNGVENVTFQLSGADAERLRRFKEREHLRLNAEAARKLFFEGLCAWEEEENAARIEKSA